MTREGRSALVTIRCGHSVTAVHDAVLAARWLDSLAVLRAGDELSPASGAAIPETADGLCVERPGQVGKLPPRPRRARPGCRKPQGVEHDSTQNAKLPKCSTLMLQATAAAATDGDAARCPETCACSLSQCKAAAGDCMGNGECAKLQSCAFQCGCAGHGSGSGAPIPEAAHSLGPGQVPKLPPRPRRARPGHCKSRAAAALHAEKPAAAVGMATIDKLLGRLAGGRSDDIIPVDEIQEELESCIAKLRQLSAGVE